MKKLALITVIILFAAAICPAAISIINAFNSGELSPQLEGRTDLSRYYSGCRTLENFLIFSYGGATRRPGTKYIATAKNSDEASRLVPFEFSTTQAYILEFGDEYIRFYKDNGQIVDVNDDPYEISTPYDTDAGTDLFELHFIQSADTMYIVHPAYKPRKLTRTGHTSWTITEIEFERGPFLDENETTTTITPAGYTIDDANTTNETFGISDDGDLTGIFDDNENFIVSGSTGNDATWTVSSTSYSAPTTTITVTGDITDATADGSAIVVEGKMTLTASAAIFDVNNHVGALWQVTHTATGEKVSGSFSNNAAAQNSASVAMQLNRKFDFTTHGTWTGDVVLQRSYDGGQTWKDVLPVHYENDGNRQFSDSETVDDAIYRVHVDANTAGIDSGTLKYNLIARSHDVAGVIDINAVATTTSASGTVMNLLGGTSATTNWAEGAWSLDEGYPATVAFYEERIAYAATTNNPQTIWFSQTGDWDNFLAGELDSDAISYTLAADQVNVIRWLSPQGWLLIGTIGGEWKIGSGTNEDPLTPKQVVAKRQSNYGSAYQQPVMVNNVILYVQRQARKVRELVFSFEVDSWLSPDLTVLSEHITDTGIVQTAFQKTPDPILWTILASGDIVAMTYQRSQEVVGWHKHTSGTADFESVAVIPGPNEDEVWVSVERTVNSNTVRYIEQFQARDWGSDQNDIFFVDSGLTFDGGAAVTITNITKATPAVVTAAAHGFSDGEQVRIADVTGMTEINDEVYTVDDANTNTFSLDDSAGVGDINSVGFTAYTSGGQAWQVENTFTTLGHLEGETVDIAADGAFYGTAVVGSNTITLTSFYNTVHAGLNYVSKLQPMKLEVPGNVISGRTKRITDITCRFHNTLQCKYGPTEDSTLDVFSFVDEDLDELEARQTLFSGDRKQEFDGDYETHGNIYLQVDEPLPCTILSILPDFEVYR